MENEKLYGNRLPRILVLLATYNGGKYIEDQLKSILAQKNVDITISISDDGSTDQTYNILKKYIEEDKIRFHKNQTSTGSAANNFLGMISRLTNENEYDYFSFADQDDIWFPDKISAAIESLFNFKSVLYCSNLTKWNTSEGSYRLLKKDYPQKKFDFLFEGGSAGCTYVFTRSFALELKQFTSNLDYSDWRGFSHDWLVYFFARSKNFKVVIDSNSYIHYRIHNANVHGHLNQMSIATIKHKSAEVFNGYYQNHLVNYIKYLDQNSEAYSICKKFLGNYFQRNYVIWKYNLQLMRDNKKFLIFAGLNLLKFK